MGEERVIMIDEKGHAICERALKHFKAEPQVNMMFEEIGEFVDAFHKYKRKRVRLETVIGELCDLMIMSEQMSILFGEEDVRRVLDDKLNKLELRVAHPTKEG